MKHYLSLGAGVQSTTLALMFAHGEMPVRLDAAIFADTQCEPVSVYRHLNWLEQEIQRCPHPFPVYRITRRSLEHESLSLRTSRKTGNLYLRSLIPAFFAKRNGKRGLMGRRCTPEFKTRLLVQQQRQLARIPRGCKEVRVQVYIGISLDEYHRMKPSKQPWAQTNHPLVDLRLTRQQCVEWMLAKGYPRPPRSACVFCPFHSDVEWRRLRDEEPEEFARAVEFDRTLRERNRMQTGTARRKGDVYLHSSLVPLDQVMFQQRDQIDLFNNECEGLCGV